VARRRLRHKLMLGLALVAGSIGLLAGGTAYGLYAYYLSNKVTEKKLQELEATNTLLGSITALEQSTPTTAKRISFRSKMSGHNSTATAKRTPAP